MKFLKYLLIAALSLVNLVVFAQEDYSQYLNSARLKFEQGKYENAQKLLNVYIRMTNDTNVELNTKISQCLKYQASAKEAEDSGDYASALSYHKSILKCNPKDPNANATIVRLNKLIAALQEEKKADIGEYGQSGQKTTAPDSDPYKGTLEDGIRTDKNKKRHVTFMPEQSSVNMRFLSSFDRNGIIGLGIYFNRSFFQLGFDVLLCSGYCDDNKDIFEGHGIDTYEYDSYSYYSYSYDEVSKALSEDFYNIKREISGEYGEEGEYIHPIVQLAASPGLNFRYFSIECGLGTFINKNVKTVEQGKTLEINKSIGPLFFVRPTITGYIRFGDGCGLSVSGGYNIVPKAKFLNAFMFSIGFFWIC